MIIKLDHVPQQRDGSPLLQAEPDRELKKYIVDALDAADFRKAAPGQPMASEPAADIITRIRLSNRVDAAHSEIDIDGRELERIEAALTQRYTQPGLAALLASLHGIPWTRVQPS